MFNPSQKQLDIFSTWQGEECNILINAVAGSGKTTTLLQLLEYCELRTLFLAFNKSVQEEIQQKIDDRGLKQGKAMTMHSLGLSAIRGAYRRCNIKSGKNFDLLKEVQTKHRVIFKSMRWEDQLKLSYTLMDMNDISRLFLTDDIEQIKKHLLSMDKGVYQTTHLPLLWNSFIEVRKESYEGNSIKVDFTDMIYLPVYKNLYIPVEPFYLMVDEAQDLNLCQHKLIDNLINQGDIKKWIAVGDRNQAIYGFSGAYSSSFDMFLSKGNVKELPLDICYRCATSIIDAANEVFDVMEYSGNDTGLVEVTNSISAIKENSMIVCRNSAPLINLYFQLLGMNKPAYIKGDDILSSILRFLKPYNKYTTDGARVEMLYKMEELSKVNTEEGRMSLYIFKENFANFKLLYNNLCDGFETVEYLIDKVKSLFVSKDDAIMLCTIHKSKGLESEVVYILNENLIPSKFARSEEQLKQEQNLKYVARSRAKKELYYLEL